MCCKLTIWFHPQEPPMVQPDWNAAACTLQWCQHACLHSHAENQVWLCCTKKKPQNTSGFSPFLSQIQSLFWVLCRTLTWELYGCARTTRVHVCTGLKQGMWIHLLKTQSKPLPGTDLSRLRGIYKWATKTYLHNSFWRQSYILCTAVLCIQQTVSEDE